MDAKAYNVVDETLKSGGTIKDAIAKLKILEIKTAKGSDWKLGNLATQYYRSRKKKAAKATTRKKKRGYTRFKKAPTDLRDRVFYTLSESKKYSVDEIVKIVGTIGEAGL